MNKFKDKGLALRSYVIFAGKDLHFFCAHFEQRLEDHAFIRTVQLSLIYTQHSVLSTKFYNLQFFRCIDILHVTTAVVFTVQNACCLTQ